jgi:hypothetical protein
VREFIDYETIPLGARVRLAVAGADMDEGEAP